MMWQVFKKFSILILILIDSKWETTGSVIPQIAGSYTPTVTGTMVLFPHYEIKSQATVLAWEFYAASTGTINFVVSTLVP